MKWIGQNIYDQISKFRNTVDFSKDVTFYQPVDNANPAISLGSSDDERFRIKINYQGTTTQVAQIVSLQTFTEGSAANDGRFQFKPDGAHVLDIDDGGIDFKTGFGISINGTDILTDSSGTATLSNIDALDATTVSTLNAALTAGDITGVTAGTNLSGGGTSGAVTINLASATTSVKGAASFSSDNFATASVGVVTIKDGGVDLTEEVTGVLPSANMDADTAHLTTAQTFTGSKTMATDVKLNFRDANSHIYSKTANDLNIVATDIVLDAATSVKIDTSDLTMYDAVNDGNPTISLGSSATDRLEIKSTYNSGTQKLCDIDFTTFTTSTSGNDGRFNWYVDEVQMAALNDNDLIVYGGILALDDGGNIKSRNTTASSATQGGILTLECDDGAAMGINHRLGVIEFSGAEDASNNRVTGASIQAMCDRAWTASENGTRLEFYTMDGNASSELSLTLDSDLLATFAGGVTVTGTITGDVTGDVTGDLTGEADTVATIAGLAPNTATTQATQAAITTCANLVTVGTIGTGVWNATAIASAKMATGTASAQGALELATTAEAITGTDTARAVTPAGLKARISQIVNLQGYAVLEDDNFQYSQDYVDNKAPFLMSQDYGSGTINSSTEVAQKFLLQAHGFHVPFACTVGPIQVQVACGNAGNISVALVEYVPSNASGDQSDYPRTIHETVVVVGAANINKTNTVDVTAANVDNKTIAAGSHLLIMVKGDGTSAGGTAIIRASIGLAW